MTGGQTDIYNFLKAGVPGLNFLFLEGKGCYHTPLDNLRNLDGRSLQHQGSHALTLARHFGNLDQDDPGEPDVIYFNPLGQWFIHYPATWVRPLALGAALCYFAFLFVGW
jgi:Peptidase family M28